MGCFNWNYNSFLLTIILAVSFGNFIIKKFNTKYLLRFGGLIFLFFAFQIFLQSSISRNILIKLWKKIIYLNYVYKVY